MAKQQIGLLFGVQGGEKLSGASGQLILQQLNKIARSIDNTNNRMKVIIGVNENQTRQLIQKQLNNISKGLKITIGGDFSNNGGQNATKNTKTTKFSEFVDGDVSKRPMSQATALKTKEELRKKQEQTHKAQLQREEQEKKNAYNEAKRAEETAERAKKKAEAEKKQAQITEKQIQAYSNQLLGMGREDDILKYGNVEGVAKQFQTYTTAVHEAKAAEAAMNANRNPQTQQAFIDAVNRAKNAQQQLNAAFKNATALDRQSLAYNKVIARITEYQAKNKETLKNTPELAAKLEELNRQLSNGTFKGTKTDAQNKFLELTNQIRKAGGEAETLWQKVKRIFGQKFGYGIMATAAMMARRAFRQIYQEVVEIDSALTQLSIVSGKSTAILREGLDSVANSAREANTSIKDMLKSMETYARLGYSLDDSEYMSKITNMYANVANTDTETATSSLTAILKGYKYEAEDLESIADILVKVGQEYAISAEELGTGLQTAGATLAVTGTDLEKSIALLTAGNAAIKCVSHSAAMYYKKVA